MFRTVWRGYGDFVVLAGLAVFAFGGWGALVYSAVTSRSEIAQLREQRDAALGESAKLSKSAGGSNEVAVKLARAKAEYDRTVLASAEARQKLAAALQELAAAPKRPDPLADLISQTGSVRPLPPKPPARKVAN